MRTSKRKKSLLQQFRWTFLWLCAAMMTLWLIFFIYMNTIIKDFTMQNMEQTSVGIIEKLNQSLLELQEISFAVNDNEAVSSLLQENGSTEFYERAGTISDNLDTVIGNSMLAENILLYTNYGKYYRFLGNISNTAAKRIFYELHGEKINKPIQITLEGVRYIVYVDDVAYQEKKLGKVVMLLDETDIKRLFEDTCNSKNMKIGLAMEGIMVASNDNEWMTMNTEEIVNSTNYLVQTKVGYTPFELFVEYEHTSRELRLFFYIAIVGTVLMLWLLIRKFVIFWKIKFFKPISGIIQGVSGLSGSRGEQLALTGMEHFDVLVKGINEMLYRIEEKEEALYVTALSLKESEIKRQNALILSLKKQINAHFTVNVLNIIKALGEQGENEKVGTMCDGLSYLLRYANDGDEFISLMEELFILEKYVGLMKIRYPGRFETEIDVEDEFADIQIPRMLVQPIVENSILHGYDEMSDEGKYIKIHIYAQVVKADTGDALNIVVEDDGRGMSTDMKKQPMEDLGSDWDTIDEVEGLSQVALRNIQRRINTYFGNDYGLRIDSKYNKGTKVILLLPIVTNSRR